MLQDPQTLVTSDRLGLLSKKLVDTKTVLARSQEKGGMPFIYAFVSTKKHFLSDGSFRKKDKTTETEDEKKEIEFQTAATNGNVYYWYPDFLEKLTGKELIVVFAHETYHIIMQHCSPIRSFGKNRHIWNLAIDYVVNSVIEYDLRLSAQNASQFVKECEDAYADPEKKIHPIWNGAFTRPMQLKELIADILTYKGLSEEEKEKKREQEKKENKKCTFADFSLYKRTAESIYNEIMDALKEAGLSPGDFNDLVGMMNSMDEHMESDITKKQLYEELLKAYTSSSRMAGTMPAGLEEILKELENPRLKWEDICRQTLTSVRKEMGSKNDWSRFRRRPLSLGMYSPKKKDDFVNFLCLLDTSGSMSMDDMAYGISQLKCLDSRAQGIIVPCDAQVYWDKAAKIRSISDLQKINIVGRGGTVFDDFFNNYRNKIKERIDLIIVLTDGGFHLDCKKPNVDTVFVITNEHMPTVPFGRVAPLRLFT